VQIFSTLGEKVQSKTLNRETDVISTQDLPAGIYFIIILKKGTIISTDKLIKMQ
jgi:hypothetical protein